MFGTSLSFIGALLVCVVILAFEQVAGLPVLFMVVSVVWSLRYQSLQRLLWLLALGVMISILYRLSFTGSLIGMAVAIEGWRLSARLIRSDVWRLYAVTVISVAVIALVTGWQVTVPGVISLLISSLIVGLFVSKLAVIKMPDMSI